MCTCNHKIHTLFRCKYTCVHLYMCLSLCVCVFANPSFMNTAFSWAFYFLWTVTGSSKTLLCSQTSESRAADFTGLIKWHHCTNTVALVAWHRVHKPQEWLYILYIMCVHVYVCVEWLQSADWERDRGFLYVTALYCTLLWSSMHRECSAYRVYLLLLDCTEIFTRVFKTRVSCTTKSHVETDKM